MGKSLVKGICVLVGVCVFFAQSALALTYHHVVVFGDSYSDNGNTYLSSDQTYPGKAYYAGRFSNGPTWSEYLVKSIGIDPADSQRFRNYAYGQAQVIDPVVLNTHSKEGLNRVWSFSIPDLSGQISQYIKEGNTKPKDSLYIVFIGTNDFLNYVPSTEKNDDKFVQARLRVLGEQVNRLIEMGADRIVVVNMRNLLSSPLVEQLSNKYGDNYKKKLGRMIQSYNKELERNYKGVSQVVIYSSNKFDELIYAQKTPTPCYVNQGNYIERVSSSCANPSDRFFFDRIHPTSSTHYLMSKDLVRVLKESEWLP